MGLSGFDYYAPETLKEVCILLEEKGEGAMLMAGGTDLLVKYKRKVVSLNTVIDVKRIKDLEKISFDESKGLTIGCAATLTAIENHPVIREKYPAVADAAHATANVQIRNMASLAGNLCNAAPSAENAPALMAMDATVTLLSSSGSRTIPLNEFFKGPGKTVIATSEIMTEVNVPVPPLSSGSSYQHISARGKVDISAVNVGSMLIIKNNRCEEARIFLGAVAPVPMMAARAQDVIRGRAITEELIKTAALEASRECMPISDIRATAEYRKLMVAVLTGRAIVQSIERATA